MCLRLLSDVSRKGIHRALEDDGPHKAEGGGVITEHIQAGRDSTKYLYPGVRVRTPWGTGEIVAPGHGGNVHGYVPLWLVRLDEATVGGLLPCWWNELDVIS